jgi:hypothetical protein
MRAIIFWSASNMVTTDAPGLAAQTLLAAIHSSTGLARFCFRRIQPFHHARPSRPMA